ncbi:hypothetical protein [Nocardioides dongkuii]|uniref:hypothetical protein n=1 Tax=Nocardioides dongkuii TaxID=2760089 RepID=UPI0015F8EF09|nr:hypothetical protein [Nocardioides dongkuii]
MEILLWLVPPAVVTAVAMCWVAWAGREAPREIDRDLAARRLERALQKDRPVRYAARTPERDRSTGVAVRPSRRAS